MNALNLKAVANRITLAAAGLVMLAGFAATTSRVETRIERALESAVTGQGRLYAAATSPVQLSTVVITGKRWS